MKPTNLVFEEVMKFWPLDTPPRPIQLEAIKKVIDSFNNGCQFVLLEVPVGGGKSALSFTIARAMGSSYFLTLTEQLQQQYTRDFAKFGMEALKGRAKYECAKAGGGYTCADGKLMYTGKNVCKPDLCPYQLAKLRAFAAPHMVANYHSYLFNLGLAAGKKKLKKGEQPLNDYDQQGDVMRELTVIDEAHAMEPFLLEQAGVTVNLGKLAFPLAPLPKETDEKNIQTQPYIDYIRDELIPKTSDYLLTSHKRGILDPKTKNELEQLLGKLHAVLQNPDDEWVAERERARDGDGFRADTFALKPLMVNRYGNWLTGFGERLLLMSGTILNAYQMCASLGLDPKQGDFHTFDSPFPAENRPVYVGQLDMSYKARDTSWPLMVEQVAKLLTSHANEKGLILAPSNKMLTHLCKELPRDLSRRILIATGENRVAKYNEHLSSRAPTVLGASGLWEGADLKGDASRFQIIPQLPRPMWQGQVAKRAKRSQGWYEWLTYVKTLQGLGRSVRSETDTAVTYILDRDFRKEFAKADSLIPLWVKSSVVLVGNVRSDEAPE